MTPLSLGLPMKSRVKQLIPGRHGSVVASLFLESNAKPLSKYPYGASRQGFCRTVTSGGTRGATAAMSRDVKRNLLKLLFQDKYSKLDPSNYTYEDLRKEYLKRLQVIHPDKINANSIPVDRLQSESQENLDNRDSPRSKDDLKKEFQELQNTWDRYEELSKSMMKVVQGDGATANFTQFGVGCSFSDNDEERALRNEITDQACRGWFSSGLVSSGTSVQTDERNNGNSKGNIASNRKSLIDDSMFVQAEASDTHDNNLDALRHKTKSKPVRRQQRTLIPGIN
mmetsp:Transcript_15527/g.39094  ORF Transcript_15527/g.39094 Transcript_15527/m.39094 type:complete len:283 (+) Transcript_15527:204-1052(+)